MPKHQVPQQYINPFTDFGFKKLFGEESSKEYLIDFLNSVFEDFIPKIKELTYHKNEHLGNSENDRNAVFDLYCKSDKDERFIIELQKVEQLYFKQRTLFYSTFAIQEQAKKGIWDFKLMPIYCIGILNFTFHDNANKYLHFGKILDIQTKEVLLDTLNFAYIECPKFNKTINKNSSNHDKWLYAFTQLSNLDHMPNELKNKIFEEFFKQANVLKLNKSDLANYNNSIKYYRDLHNIEEQNLQKGLQKGVQQGIKQGIQQGIKQGIELGEHKKALAIAKALKNTKNLTIEQIAHSTGLNVEEIKKI